MDESASPVPYPGVAGQPEGADSCIDSRADNKFHNDFCHKAADRFPVSCPLQEDAGEG